MSKPFLVGCVEFWALMIKKYAGESLEDENSLKPYRVLFGINTGTRPRSILLTYLKNINPQAVHLIKGSKIH